MQFYDLCVFWPYVGRDGLVTLSCLGLFASSNASLLLFWQQEGHPLGKKNLMAVVHKSTALGTWPTWINCTKVSCHVAMPSSTTLTTMRCQSPLSSEALMSCVGLTLSFNESHRLSRYFSL